MLAGSISSATPAAAAVPCPPWPPLPPCILRRPVLLPALLLLCSYSPHITEMKVLESRRVRRAKLFYLRERNAKEYRT